MNKEIVHRRLYAFFNSQVLNSLYWVAIIFLIQIPYWNVWFIPVICSAVAFLLFIGYTLWFWIKKPKSTIINTWLSNMTTWFTLYFLAFALIKEPSIWWGIFPLVAAIVMLFISLLRSFGRPFEI